MVTLDDAGRDAPDLIFVDSLPLLAPFVEHAWVQARCTPSTASAARRVVPDPSAHLVIVVSRDGRTRGHLVGSRTTFCDIETDRRFTIGIRLRPGTVPLLTRTSARELVDRGMPLSDVLPETDRAFDQASAGRAHEALGTLLHTLSEHLQAAGAPDWRVRAVDALWRNPRAPRGVASSARHLGLASRTLHEVASAEVGLSPSFWQRIVRLHGSIRLALTEPDRSLARVAAAAGYHDQSHMAREFRDLVGEAPTTFLGRGSCRSVQGKPRPER